MSQTAQLKDLREHLARLENQIGQERELLNRTVKNLTQLAIERSETLKKIGGLTLGTPRMA